MKRLIEQTFNITARQAAQALPTSAAQGTVEFTVADRYTQRIRLVSTPANTGGLFYWFVCPGCGSRVRKLYLPYDEAAFLFRTCHDLGYGVQQSRTFRHERSIVRSLLLRSAELGL